MKYSPLLILGLFTLLLACKKEKTSPVPYEFPIDISDCHYSQSWDSTKTHAALIGEWQWKYIQCFWTPNDANGDDYAGLEIKFKPDNTLEVRENGVLTQTASWKIQTSFDDSFEVETVPEVVLLYGHIAICNDIIAFSHSYIDGCDNYYKRK